MDAKTLAELTARFHPLRSKPPRTEARPCRLCGWGPARGIHSRVISGPRKGEPWGHKYVPTKPKTAADNAATGAPIEAARAGGGIKSEGE